MGFLKIILIGICLLAAFFLIQELYKLVGLGITMIGIVLIFGSWLLLGISKEAKN